MLLTKLKQCSIILIYIYIQQDPELKEGNNVQVKRKEAISGKYKEGFSTTEQLS